MFWKTSIFGLTYLAPSSYPSAKRRISGMSMPPTKPTLPVLDAIAAAMPTRNEPSCSLKTIDCTFGRSTTASTIANLRFGNSLATFSMPLACEKPIPTTTAEPRRAMLRSACSRWASAVTSNSRYAIPVSFLKRSAPAYAASLNDLSNLPPISNTTAGTNSCAVAGPIEAKPRRTATAALSDLASLMCAPSSVFDRRPASLDSISSATGVPMIYDLPHADRAQDLHGEPAGLLRSGTALLRHRARAVRGGPRVRGARSVGARRSGEDRDRAAAAIRLREARGLAQAEPRDRRHQPGCDRPRRRAGRGARRGRRRQRHRGRDRLRLCARQADRRLSGRFQAQRGQRRLDR